MRRPGKPARPLLAPALFFTMALAPPVSADDATIGRGKSIDLGGIGAVSPSPPFCLPHRPPTVIHYAPRVSLLPTPFGFVPYAPPLIVASGPFFPVPTTPPILPPPGGLFGPFAPAPVAIPPEVARPALPPAAAGQGGIAAEGRSPDRAIAGPIFSARAGQLLTFGDRNFRAGDLRRAGRRYEEALAEAPRSALPRARLAQVAFVRGEYREAADRLREAITAEPDWPANAHDLQALYAEPADFHAAVGRLEAHLQADPGDRDGWLVLAAQLLLTDRADRAADVLLRLDDDRADPALNALMAAAGLGH